MRASERLGGFAIFCRLARRSESDFFLVGRGQPGWLPAVSVCSTHAATDSPCGSRGDRRQRPVRLRYAFFTAGGV